MELDPFIYAHSHLFRAIIFTRVAAATHLAKSAVLVETIQKKIGQRLDEKEN